MNVNLVEEKRLKLTKLKPKAKSDKELKKLNEKSNLLDAVNNRKKRRMIENRMCVMNRLED